MKRPAQSIHSVLVGETFLVGVHNKGEIQSMRQNRKNFVERRTSAVAGLVIGILPLIVYGLTATVALPNVAAAIVPPTVTTGAVTSVRPTSAVISGVVNPQGKPTNWTFQYGPNTTFVSNTPLTSAGAGITGVRVSRSLTGLTPATSYYFRIVASSSARTTYGGSGTFNTTAAPVVVSGAASNVGTNTATLNGNINSEALSTSWYFEYGQNTHYGSKSPTKYLAASRNGTNVSFGISGLSVQSIYHFRIVAHNSAGTSVSADFTFSTGLPVTLNTSTSVTIYGSGTSLFGTVLNGRSGDQVTIEGEKFNQTSLSSIATIVTGNGGAWSYSVDPSVRTTYEAFSDAGSSSPIIVSVRPAVSITQLSRGRLLTQVVGSVPFATHVLQLQILSLACGLPGSQYV